ncbi:MAG TPA: gamma carbonic anhydrase family protein [Tepidisphaeraceae bacterium]|nr:gamma carbonic anhydrase family protein [Tepidisphaeraceae bacterium]
MSIRFRKTKSNWFIAPSATVVGDVRIGEQSSIWFNTVIRGDVAAIRIGSRVNVQDNAIIHCDGGVPNVIEDDVCIGHSAIVHGEFVGTGSLIGMGAKLLGRTKVGRGSLVAAGAVLSPGMKVPDGMVAMGVPAKIVRAIKPDEIELVKLLVKTYIELAEKYFAGEFDDAANV